MQLDYGLIKRILNVMIEKPSYYIHTSEVIETSKSPYIEIDINDYKNLFYGHLLILKDKGVIEELTDNKLGVEHNLSPCPSYGGCYIRLTALGYDFLKVLSKDGFIEKFKKCTITECIKIGEAVISNGITSYINNMF